MGNEADQDRRFVATEETVSVEFRFAIMGGSLRITCISQDGTEFYQTRADMEGTRSTERNWLREAVWNVTTLARAKCRALRHHGFDRERITEWNAQAMAAELFRILRRGVMAERAERRGFSAPDLASVAPIAGADK